MTTYNPVAGVRDERKELLGQSKLDLMAIADFMPEHQMDYLRECFHSRNYENDHAPALRRLAETITSMPKTYEQDGKGDEAITYLHYFYAGCDWWIIEIDAGSPDDEPEDIQSQAFGLVSLNHEDPELGYISIREICQHGRIELDFHFKPTTVGDIKTRRR